MKRILKDRFGRVHNYLRISLTDSCNLNCIYCNPAGSNGTAVNDLFLGFEQLNRLIKIFSENLGIKKLRFTGGEPLARKNVIQFFESIRELKKENNLEYCITTNGTLLINNIEKLINAGIDRFNISLDTLKNNSFTSITGKNKLNEVINSIYEAEEKNGNPVKVNCVVIKKINDGELTDFIEFFKDKNIIIRFIEYMPFTKNGWDESLFISCGQMKNKIEDKYTLKPIPDLNNSVSDEYEVEGCKCNA
jgi:cyclic pyranopterin phosphate synthase